MNPCDSMNPCEPADLYTRPVAWVLTPWLSKGLGLYRRNGGVPLTMSSGGLSGLVKQVLGLRLDKREQTSDWGARPLSESQTVYAALDALVLVRVCNALCREAGEGGGASDPSLIVERWRSEGGR